MTEAAVTHPSDRLFRGAISALALIAPLLLVLVFVQLARAAAPMLDSQGLEFFWSRTWNVVTEKFGALPFIFGTVVTSLLALALATPVALGVGIFLSEFAHHRVGQVLGFMVELLAAIPSVVYGLWGMYVLAPWLRDSIQPALANTLGFLPFFQGTPRGFGIMAASLILAVMVIPTIASMSREVLRAVPRSYREGALALGATPWETVRHAVLPSALSGIVGATLLGLGRALGETMAVAMLIGNRPEIHASLFAPAATMASVIANEYAETSSDLHLAALSALGLCLLTISVLLNACARLLVWRMGRR